jgi:hypothetical protein
MGSAAERSEVELVVVGHRPLRMHFRREGLNILHASSRRYRP